MTGFRGKIYDDFTQTVGATPIVRLSRLAKAYDIKANLLAKCEFFNPLSSVKDRIGLALIADMEARGLAIPGKTTLIEPTSGNTGIALAFVAASKGYDLILTMPESMSLERRKMLKLLEAKLVLTPADKGMKGAIAKAEALAQEMKDAAIVGQFTNPANPEIHKRTTAEEIWQDCNHKVDMFVAGIGTGGTITGVGTVLKNYNPNCKVIAVEPEDSPILSKGTAGPHKIQGIGAGFIPEILDVNIYDEVVRIANETAFRMAREVAKLEGIACGISSGAALGAAIECAAGLDMEDKNIVIILPSFAERYLSTSLFEGL